MRNWIFVKVLTDQPGLFGWGEATLEWHTRGVVGAIEDISQLLIGEDVTRIEHLWQVMYRQHFWHGNGIVRGTAISGIDIALWDILGKIHGVPCHKLWGGPVRDYVRLYCHLGGGKMEEFYAISPADAPRFADLARQAVAEGFTAFKAMAVPETMPLEGLTPIHYAEKCVGAMRDAVGEQTDIMVDCHARPSPRMGLLFAKVLEPFGLYWLEEPCWPETMDDIALIQRSVKTPIATGERLVGLHAFRELLEKRAASVIQPDITHCGGFSEVRRVAALAEAYRVALAPHNPQGPVSTAASLELGFATPSYVICESVHADVPWRADVVAEGFTVEKQEMLQRSFYKDGSVGDW
jgi:galactonate dehydratase